MWTDKLIIYSDFCFLVIFLPVSAKNRVFAAIIDVKLADRVENKKAATIKSCGSIYIRGLSLMRMDSLLGRSYP